MALLQGGNWGGGWVTKIADSGEGCTWVTAGGLCCWSEACRETPEFFRWVSALPANVD